MYLLRFISCIVLLALPGHVSSKGAIMQPGSSDEKALKWLSENAKKEGVIAMPSGLQYKVIKKGSGTVHPEHATKCLWYYRATTLDGRVIFSTDKGAENLHTPEKSDGEYKQLAPLDVIVGWGWAMRLMVQGDKWKLYIPAELGFGPRFVDQLATEVSAHDVIIITTELVGMDPEFKKGPRCPQGTFGGCSEEDAAFLAAARLEYGSDTAAMQKAFAQFNADAYKYSSDEKKSDAMYRKAHLLLGLRREAEVAAITAGASTAGERATAGDEL